MKRWIRAAARLYPAEWRTRYGAEFDLLLDDAPLRWNDLADVIRGATIMRMTNWMTYWKIALLAGTAGAVIAVGIAFSIPDRWVCTSALILEEPGAPNRQVLNKLQEADLKILGRDNLIRLLQDRQLGLYPKELQYLAIEDVAESVFRKNLHVIPYAGYGDDSHQAFRIVFSYDDRSKARAVVDQLTDAFQEFLTVPDGVKLTVLERPMVPEIPAGPNRLVILIFGLVAGVLIGLLSLKLWRRTRDYAVVTMSLPKDAKHFVDRQITVGQYRNASDYIGALIRAEEERRK